MKKVTEIRRGLHWDRMMVARAMVVGTPVISAAVMASAGGHLTLTALAAAIAHPLNWVWG